MERYRETMNVDVLHAWAEEAQAELEALRKDAERYRKWRREYTANSWQDSGMLSALADAWSEDAVDAAIDAAMKDKP